MPETFDLIIVGSGFAGSFFLAKYLENAAPDARVLVLERGFTEQLSWQAKTRRSSRIDTNATFVMTPPERRWNFSVAFGGSSNCWWACVPRQMPADFETFSRYGVGIDWPLSYDDLEPYYTQAEEIMAVSGPSDGSPSPRSKPYPQPPHNFNDIDRRIKAAFPDQFYPQPTARAREKTRHRAMCCASGVCTICPINAKFTILNEMSDFYADERVRLEEGATVTQIETAGDVATGVTYVQDGAERRVQGELVALAANGIFNPFLMLKSGFEHRLLGKRLNEQLGYTINLDLDGLDNYGGSTVITGHGYMFYDGLHRSEYAGSLLEVYNVPLHHDADIRLEKGRWRQRVRLKFIFEDIPDERNYVTINKDDPTKPETVFVGHSEYTERGLAAMERDREKLFQHLPVEGIVSQRTHITEAHIQGTTLMGHNPADSIVDRYLRHHRVRNLLVLGSSVYPTCPPANPTLTISALSMWAADNL